MLFLQEKIEQQRKQAEEHVRQQQQQLGGPVAAAGMVRPPGQQPGQAAPGQPPVPLPAQPPTGPPAANSQLLNDADFEKLKVDVMADITAGGGGGHRAPGAVIGGPGQQPR